MRVRFPLDAQIFFLDKFHRSYDISSSRVKYIIVSGGVLSGLGKGITAASIGLLLRSRGVKVTLMKCDMYLNIDAGTMNPMEHGEVFVTHDGLETDQDLGHYERFTNLTLNSSNYVTNGKIYKLVLDKERALEYGGNCVEPYHQIPPEIIKLWLQAGQTNKADVVIIELGGTVGEYEGLLFFEAFRRLKLEHPKDVCLVHVGYLPAPTSIGELKSKPIQQSIIALNSLGVMPDFVIGRASKDVDNKRKEKIAMMSGLPIENIISNPDLPSVYLVPDKLEAEKLPSKIIKRLSLKAKRLDLNRWHTLIKSVEKATNPVKIGIVGKYQNTGDYILEDSYVSVVEALKHAGYTLGVKPVISWVNSQGLETKNNKEITEILERFDGIIVPQGWGKRGVEGKLIAVKFARENNIPYLGLCFGMQMASIEFARNVLRLRNANTTEADPDTKYPVIHIMTDQQKYLKMCQYGGTIRLGAWPCIIKKGTILENSYKKFGNVSGAAWNIARCENDKITGSKHMIIYERHRHRYEFNNRFKEAFEKHGFVISGTSPDGKLVEAIELKNHKFFVGTQFHPEYISRPLTPHPLFISFLTTCLSK